MIGHPAFPVEAWTVTETDFSPEIVAQTETLFTVANGYLGLRGNLEEGVPVYQPGSYLNGFYESRPTLSGDEPPSARVETSETQLNVTDGKIVRLSVNGSPLNVMTGRLRWHRRVLDMAEGELTRDLCWEAPRGGTVRVRTRRLVSLATRELAAISYRVDALEEPVTVELTSSLVANESTQMREDDPREAAPLYGRVLLHRRAEVTGSRVLAAYTTRSSRLNVVTVADHEVTGHPSNPQPVQVPGEVGVRYRFSLEAGTSVTLTKLLAYEWSSERPIRELADAASAVVDRASAEGFDRIVERHRSVVRRFWDRADIEVDGDPELQQGLRFGLYQLLQATAAAGELGVAAKGLTGQGYDGHRFWDSEVFLVPVLSRILPEAARALLAFRCRTLDAARARAETLGYAGALFPWRTISGTEVSSYFPEGTAAFHLAADIAYAVTTYVRATGDRAFLTEGGAELLVETARLWLSLGHHDPARGAFCIDEVTGPDEYSALVDNNLYTNVMAAANLSEAASVLRSMARDAPADYARIVVATGLEAAELDRFEQAAATVYVPYDEELGIHPQDDAFLHHRRFDLAALDKDHFPLLLYFHPLVLYGAQVVKQADVVLALHLLGDRFDMEDKRRDFAYYEPITVHDSSLSASSHAVVAAELGRLEDALRYLRACVLVDLDNLANNVRDGVHLAGVASGWQAVVEGLAGFRHRSGGIAFAPVLPEPLSRIRFSLLVAGARLDVEITGPATTYRLEAGERVSLLHHGRSVELDAATPEVVVANR